MMKKLALLLMTCLLLSCLTLTGCGQANEADPGAVPGGPEELEGEVAEEEVAEGDHVLTVAMECSYAPYNWTQPQMRMVLCPLRTLLITRMAMM